MRTDFPGLPAGIVPATSAMVERIGRNLRREHEREANAMLPLGGVNALRLAFDQAAACFAGMRGGVPLFVFGVGETAPLTGAAYGWLMGTAAMDRHGVWIAETSRAMLPVLHRIRGARRIHNWIPHDYTAALRWLAWLGFEIGPPEPVFNGVPHVHVFHQEA